MILLLVKWVYSGALESLPIILFSVAKYLGNKREAEVTVDRSLALWLCYSEMLPRQPAAAGCFCGEERPNQRLEHWHLEIEQIYVMWVT
jgi:hypothetical protein